MVDFGAQQNFSDRSRYTGILSLSNGTDDILLNQVNGRRGTRPRLSAYWEQHLPARQLFVLSAGASMFLGNTYSDYVESLEAVSAPITDIHTKIHDRNQAYAVEADYIKNWKSSRLTAGVSYTANRNRSSYDNLDGEIFHQRQDQLYFFGEYFQRFGKFTATAGIGGQYTSFKFRENNRGNSSWNIRPELRFGYTPRAGHRIRIQYSSWQSAPSLSESNIVPQQTDGFQWTVGNPDLETSTTHSLQLQYSFSVPRVTGTFGCSYYFSPNPITPYLYWDDDRLVTSYENSDSWRKFRVYLYPQIEVVPNWLIVSAGAEYLVERTKGTGYKLHNNNFCYNITAMLTHRGFSLTVMYNRAQKSLWGERITWGENISIAELSYNWKKWQFTLGMLMPFGRYDQGNRMVNRWNTNEQHMGLDMRMPYIKINYNLQWGRQRRGASKLVDVDAEAGTSKAASR